MLLRSEGGLLATIWIGIPGIGMLGEEEAGSSEDMSVLVRSDSLTPFATYPKMSVTSSRSFDDNTRV